MAIIGFRLLLLPLFTVLNILIFIFIFWFYSFGGLSAFWKMEAKNYFKDVGDKNKPEEKKKLGEYTFDLADPTRPPRPQSDYFKEHGKIYQHIGLSMALLVSSLLFLFCFKSIVIASLIPVATIIFLLFYNKEILSDKFKKLQKPPKLVILLVAYTTFIMSWFVESKWLLSLSNFMLVLNYLILYRGMTYKEYVDMKKILDKFSKKLKNLKEFLFYPK